MTIPAIYSACRAWPDVRWVMVTRPFPATLFVNPPHNLILHPVDLSNYKGIRGMMRLAAELRRTYKPSHFIDLHDVLRTKLLRFSMRLHGVGVSVIHKGRSEKRRLTSPKNKNPHQLTPTIDRYADTIRRAGFAFELDFRSVYTSLPDPRVFNAATKARRDAEQWIAIAPFAGHKGKTLPESTVRNLVAELIKEPDTRLFIFGAGAEENAAIERILTEIPPDKAVNMAALRIGLQAEMALIAHCNAMISMDSSNMHIASLVGTRVVSIWGATHRYAGFLGWRQAEDDVVELPLPCRPCSVYGNRPCTNSTPYECLRAITPAHIISALRRHS